jgi:hypothetical protein
MLGTADFTATNGTTVVLASGASSGDLVATESFYVSSVLNAIPATNGAVTTPYLLDAAVTQSKIATGVAGKGPAFSAYGSGVTALPASAATKVLFQAIEFDTASCYNTSTSVFTPTVAGYYQFNTSVDLSSPVSSNSYIAFYKNGATYKYGFHINASSYSLNLSSLIYCNGSTDYIEVYVYQTSGGSINTNPTNTGVYFQGVLVRAA